MRLDAQVLDPSSAADIAEPVGGVAGQERAFWIAETAGAHRVEIA
jgi:hypothetical protein